MHAGVGHIWECRELPSSREYGHVSRAGPKISLQKHGLGRHTGSRDDGIPSRPLLQSLRERGGEARLSSTRLDTSWGQRDGYGLILD